MIPDVPFLWHLDKAVSKNVSVQTKPLKMTDMAAVLMPGLSGLYAFAAVASR